MTVNDPFEGCEEISREPAAVSFCHRCEHQTDHDDVWLCCPQDSDGLTYGMPFWHRRCVECEAQS